MNNIQEISRIVNDIILTIRYQALKNLLIKLSELNSLANKGYRALSDEDEKINCIIYSTKNVILNYICCNYPQRCVYVEDIYDEYPVLYIYDRKRQYSFHVEKYFPIPDQIKRYSYFDGQNIWDKIKYAWRLSDSEYLQLYNLRQQQLQREQHKEEHKKRTKQPDFIDKLEKLKKIRSAERREIETKKQEELLLLLIVNYNKRVTKTKMYKEKQYDKLKWHYSNKLDLSKFHLI